MSRKIASGLVEEKAIASRIASLGDEHDAIIAVWFHGLRQNEGEG
jgi:hypothetical protein